VLKRKKQVYGTEYKVSADDPSILVRCPIENEPEVNFRRQKIGLDNVDPLTIPNPGQGGD
jgi:hypothetical protein